MRICFYIDLQCLNCLPLYFNSILCNFLKNEVEMLREDERINSYLRLKLRPFIVRIVEEKKLWQTRRQRTSMSIQFNSLLVFFFKTKMRDRFKIANGHNGTGPLVWIMRAHLIYFTSMNLCSSEKYQCNRVTNCSETLKEISIMS